MKVAVVATKRGKICKEFGVWEDPGDAFRSLSEMGENVGKYDVLVVDLKKLFSIMSKDSVFVKIHDGLKSDYYHT
jgi:hypothetical protein